MLESAINGRVLKLKTKIIMNTNKLKIKTKSVEEVIKEHIDSFFCDQGASDVYRLSLRLYERAIAGSADITDGDKDDFLLQAKNVNRLLYALEGIAEPFA
jgi:hypothetical protein